MKALLTDRNIAKLVAPSQGRLEVQDQKMPGLAIRVALSGKKTWTVVWHQGRQTRRHAFGTYRRHVGVCSRDGAANSRRDRAG